MSDEMPEKRVSDWFRQWMNNGLPYCDDAGIHCPKDALLEELRVENERLRAVLRTLLADLDNEGGRGYASAIIARDGEVRGQSWSRPSRPRDMHENQLEDKVRWVWGRNAKERDDE